jgi:hypothetical protein
VAGRLFSYIFTHVSPTCPTKQKPKFSSQLRSCKAQRLFAPAPKNPALTGIQSSFLQYTTLLIAQLIPVADCHRIVGAYNERPFDYF